MEKRLFYVTAYGQPLGIMTMADALTWAFANGHAVLLFESL